MKFPKAAATVAVVLSHLLSDCSSAIGDEHPSTLRSALELYQQTVTLEVVNEPLEECLHALCSQVGLKLSIDEAAIGDDRLDLQAEQTLSYRDVTFRFAIYELTKSKERKRIVPFDASTMFDSQPRIDHYIDGNTFVLTTPGRRSARTSAATPDWLAGHWVEVDRDSQVESVRIDQDVDNGFFKRLAALPNLRRLSLYEGRGYDIDAFRELSKSQTLVELEMSHRGRPGDPKSLWECDEALKHIGKISTLRRISARDCGISDAGLAHLANLSQLEQLDLHQNRVTDAGLKSLAKMTHLKSLTLTQYVRHSYGANNITDAGIAYIAHLTNLEQLNLRGGHATSVFLNFPKLTSLTLGTLGSATITDDDLQELKQFTNLKRLEINSTGVTDDGLTALESLTQLESLDLNCLHVTDAGIAHLVGLPIKTLSLRGPQISDAGLVSIGQLSQLERLTLHGGTRDTTTAGYRALAALPHLRHLWFFGCGATGSRSEFAALSQLDELVFDASNLRMWTQADLDQLGQQMPYTSISVGTGGGIYRPASQSSSRGFKLPPR